MPGTVACDLTTVPIPDAPIGLVARVCPSDEAYGHFCVKYDERMGAIAVCPFWYGTVIHSGPHPWELRDLLGLLKWMSTSRGMQHRAYHTRCLLGHAGGTEVGARL